jgi:hypothetical protein
MLIRTLIRMRIRIDGSERNYLSQLLFAHICTIAGGILSTRPNFSFPSQSGLIAGIADISKYKPWWKQRNMSDTHVQGNNKSSKRNRSRISLPNWLSNCHAAMFGNFGESHRGKPNPIPIGIFSSLSRLKVTSFFKNLWIGIPIPFGSTLI